MTELPKLKNAKSISSNGSWTIGELADPAALPSAPGAKREEEAPSGVAVISPEKEVFILTPKESNKAREVESLTLTKLPGHKTFALSELPEQARDVAIEKLTAVAKENGQVGLAEGLKTRIAEAQDVGLADSKAESTINQLIGEILKKDGKAFYEEKAAALSDKAIDEKSPELLAQSKEAAAQAKANEAAGEDRSLSNGNPRRTQAERSDAEALGKTSWAQKAIDAKEKLAKGDTAPSR
ncbi:MAG: hypothetical protein FJX23_06505 [Alphaproteobacteria bacterium]|nr:hypothetical protein [Alphaproteobacteria bacterium]